MIRILCKAAWGDGRAGGRRAAGEAVAGPCPYPHGGGSTAAPTPHCPPNCSGNSMSTRSSSGQGVGELALGMEAAFLAGGARAEGCLS